MKGGDAPTVALSSPDGASVPVRKLTTVGGEFLSWAEDGKIVTFALGRTMFRYDLAAAKAAEDAQKQRDAKDKAAGADEKKPARQVRRREGRAQEARLRARGNGDRRGSAADEAERHDRASRRADHHDAAVGFRRAARRGRDRTRRHRDHRQPDRRSRTERSGSNPGGRPRPSTSPARRSCRGSSTSTRTSGRPGTSTRRRSGNTSRTWRSASPPRAIRRPRRRTSSRIGIWWRRDR